MSEPRHGIFGIDLGTTYSVVGYIDDTGRAAVTRNGEGFDTTPSVVYFENEGNVVVGKTAKEAAGQDPDRVVSLIKREMGNRDYLRTIFGVEYSPPAISALILQALAKEAEEDTGRKVSDVVITVPAYFGLLEKDATRMAGELAGLNVIGIVPEPVAAALQYGVSGSADGTTVLVYDLGGGTFDVSLIKMTDTAIEVLVVGGDHKLGGADWDAKLLDYIVDETVTQCGDDSLREDEPMLQELRILAEETKKALSTRESKTEIVRYTGNPAKVTMTRPHFEQLTAELLDETIRITRRTLADAEQKYPGIGEQISEVLLVGGSSRMLAVSAALKAEFGWDPKLADPDLAVAKGAALYAAGQTVRFVDTGDDATGDGTGASSASGADGAASAGPVTDYAVRSVADDYGLDEDKVRDLAKRTVVNVLPKAIGIKLLDADAPGWETDPTFYVRHLVDAQTQLPHEAAPFRAGTAVVSQQEIEIEIWEQAGASPDRALVANHALDASGRISGLAPYALPAGSPIDIEVRVDAEGTVHLSAVEPVSGGKLKLEVRISILTQEQEDKAREAVTALAVRT